VGAIEDLDQSQKPEIAGCNSHHRWDFLIAGLLAGTAVSLTRHVLADAISGGEAERKDEQIKNDI
jgi:hypothetical protein